MKNIQDGVFPAVCPLDCPDTCGLLLHKKDGKLVKIEGNPEHPVTKGAICNKVRHAGEWMQHPDRLTQPLKRVGPKGRELLYRSAGMRPLPKLPGSFAR